MHVQPGLLLAALLLFVATNIDDLLLLIAIHSDQRRRYPGQAVLLGQVIGFSAIVLISLIGFWFHLLIPANWLACLGVLPLALGLKQLWPLIHSLRSTGLRSFPPGYVGDPEDAPPLPASWRRTSSKVAALTLANGSDNISVYLPTFAKLQSADLLLTIGTFYVGLLLLWQLSTWLAFHPRWQEWIRRTGPVLSPTVLIGLGLWLLKDSVVWQSLS